MESENVTGGEVLGRSSAFMPGAIDQRALMGLQDRSRVRQSYDDVSGGVQVPPYPPQPADLDPLSDVARRVNSLPAFGIPPSPDLITTAALLQAQAQAQAAAATLGLYPTDGGMNGGMNGGLNPGPMADPLSNLVSQNTMLQAALLQAELNRAMVLGLSLSAATPSGGSQTSQQSGGSRHHLFKTELCRSHEDTGICRYGNKCQFAHGAHELKPLLRHPKYKTELCRTFIQTGHCPYGARCRFVHATSAAEAVKMGLVASSETSVNPNRVLAQMASQGGVRRMVSESHAQPGRVLGVPSSQTPTKAQQAANQDAKNEAMANAKAQGLADLSALTAAIEEFEMETGHRVNMVELQSPTGGNSPRGTGEDKLASLKAQLNGKSPQ